MNITSVDFLFFITIISLLFFMVPAKIQWLYLLICSYYFYSFAGISGLLFLAGSTFITWCGAIGISKISNEKKGLRRFLFFTVLCLTLLVLIIPKYFAPEGFTIPLGISFYVFMSVSYLADVYLGKTEAEKNPFKYALFTGFYPLLSQGPICRYNTLSAEFEKKHVFSLENIGVGITRISYGYFKKLMIADKIGVLVTSVTDVSDVYNGAWFFLTLIAYTIQLYMDFSGGIDITIGTAKLIGITLPENFMQPLFSRSIGEFWRRWHITMGSWFRDYIYIPLGGNRVSKFRLIINLFVVWLATGIWHGKGLNYIVWGLCNFVILALSRIFDSPIKKFHEKTKLDKNPIYIVFQIIRTYLLAACFFTLFCYPTLTAAFSGFTSMFTAGNWNIFVDGSLLTMGLGISDYIIIGAGLILVFFVSLIKELKKEKLFIQFPFAIKAFGVMLIIFSVLIFGSYGKGYDASAFIYNRF